MRTIYVVCPKGYSNEDIVLELLERYGSDETGWMTWHESLTEAENWYNQLPSKKNELKVVTVTLKATMK